MKLLSVATLVGTATATTTPAAKTYPTDAQCNAFIAAEITAGTISQSNLDTCSSWLNTNLMATVSSAEQINFCTTLGCPDKLTALNRAAVAATASGTVKLTMCSRMGGAAGQSAVVCAKDENAQLCPYGGLSAISSNLPSNLLFSDPSTTSHTQAQVEAKCGNVCLRAQGDAYIQASVAGASEAEGAGAMMHGRFNNLACVSVAGEGWCLPALQGIISKLMGDMGTPSANPYCSTTTKCGKKIMNGFVNIMASFGTDPKKESQGEMMQSILDFSCIINPATNGYCMDMMGNESPWGTSGACASHQSAFQALMGGSDGGNGPSPSGGNAPGPSPNGPPPSGGNAPAPAPQGPSPAGGNAPAPAPQGPSPAGGNAPGPSPSSGNRRLAASAKAAFASSAVLSRFTAMATVATAPSAPASSDISTACKAHMVTEANKYGCCISSITAFIRKMVGGANGAAAQAWINDFFTNSGVTLAPECNTVAESATACVVIQGITQAYACANQKAISADVGETAGMSAGQVTADACAASCAPSSRRLEIVDLATAGAAGMTALESTMASLGESVATRDAHRRLSASTAGVSVTLGSQSASQTNAGIDALKAGVQPTNLEAQTAVDGLAPPTTTVSSSTTATQAPATTPLKESAAATLASSAYAAAAIAIAAAALFA